MSAMQFGIDLSDNRHVVLCGSTATYWAGEGAPTYEGALEGLPESVIEELIVLPRDCASR